MTNIPAGYNEDGEYVGYGYMPETEQHFVKVPLTPEEIDVLDRGLVELSIQTNFPPADKETLGLIISAGEKLRLAKAEYDSRTEETY